MSENLSITYTPTVDDLVALSLYHRAHSPSMSRTLSALRILGAVGLFLVITVARGHQLPQFILAAVVSVVFYITIPLMWKFRLISSTRKAYVEGKKKGKFGHQTIVIADDGITVSYETGESNIRWLGIERITQTPGYTFVYVGALNAFVIPEQIEEGDHDAFVTELKRRWEVAQAEQPIIG